MSKNRRRYGGYVVHLGIVVMAVGIAISSTYRREREVTLGIGQAVTYEGYTVRLDSLYAGREPHREFVEAAFSIGKGGEVAAVMRPRLNYYPMSQQPIGTPKVRTRPTVDLYLSLMAYDRTGSSATVNVIVNPMVVWIWIGGAIASLGALFAISSVGIIGTDRPRGAEEARGRTRPMEAGVGGDDR
jgi:cytochrome c-type biogenesis protein CcmF